MSSKIAIITGGHGDLARGIATALGGASFEVKSPSRSELDVTDSDSVSRYFDSFERLDLLVNNAGITGDGLLARQGPSDWAAVIDTNLKGAHLCSQAAALIMMRQREGHIVNIGSYSGDHPPLGQTAYAAAKSGLIGLTKSFAREFGKRNLKINCVLPGFLETKMTAGLSDEAKAATKQRHQLGRFNTIEEAAGFISYLASTENISGQVFQLDSRA
ncbi:MAG: SDR family oxidoreductase [Verrucomicrobiales bacterium]|nr:SDR family oxidoreductase [Verrucomicrobiales bacterium]